jgi:hypothetical protein
LPAVRLALLLPGWAVQAEKPAKRQGWPVPGQVSVLAAVALRRVLSLPAVAHLAL